MKQGALLALAVGLSSFASASDTKPAAIAGFWKLHLTEDQRAVSDKFGLPQPAAAFKFGADGSFEYVSGGPGKESRRQGRYELHESLLRLTWKDGANLPDQASLGDSGLSFDGFSYSREVSIDVLGTWVLTTDRGQDPSIRVTFGKDGSFEFRCSNAVSKGKYRLDGVTLLLEWTEVDGEKVQAGSMKKALQLNEDGSGFMVDRFRYSRKLP